MAGAYGNVGGLAFLTINTFVNIHTFFYVLSGAAALAFVFVQFLKEPKGHTVEVNDDGTLQRIEVA
jgi:MFS transporter, NNP family, nitrate/nitrite transporter